MSSPRFAVAVLAVLTAGALSINVSPAAARHAAYTLHVRAESAEGRGINFSVPWKSSHGGSPFDFTAQATHDDISTDKLRFAWAALHKLPEGQPVILTTHDGKIKASRRNGFLVLEPQPAADHDRARIKIPDYIIDATLAHDGRLTDEDLDELVAARGKITLVKVSSTDGGVNVWIGRSGGDDDLD